MNSNTGNLLSSLYGTSTAGAYGYGSTAPSTGTTLSPAVAARVQQALQGQKGTIDKLNADVASDQTRLSGLGQLQSALAAFGTLAEGISGAGLATSATSSTKGVLSAATGTGAQAGTYKVDVRQLAQNQIVNSATQPLADTKIGSGSPATVKIDIGSMTADGFKAGGAAKSITIDSSNNTLDGIAKALKGAGVDAVVVKGEAGYSLQVKGKDGAAQAIRIGVTGDASLKAAIGYDPAAPEAGGMKQAQAAQDALLTVNGKEVASASNTIAAGAIAGTSLTLTGTGTTDVTVSQDSSQIGKNVAAFVKGYNELSTRLATLQAGALKGDATLTQVSNQLAQLVKMGGSGANALADAGVTQDAKGQLVVDEKKLNAAIAADPSAVSKLFTNEGRGIADKLDKKIDALSGDGGAIARSRKQVTRELDVLADRKEQLSKSLTVQARALAQLYTMQEQSGGTGSLLDLLG